MERMGLLASLATAVLFTGCALAPERTASVPSQLFADSAFDAPSRRIDAADVFAISPAMRRYLEVEIGPQIRNQGRQRGLVDALYNRAQLRLDYDTELTRNAAETFEARAGNCLSLVVMTAALAKHLQLPVTFQSLGGQETWSRNGDLSFVSGHVNITVAKRLVDRVYGLDPDTQVRLSFGALSAGRGAMLKPVSEETIVAMFMNNRAAESLVRGSLADAYAYAREAIRQDPTYPSGFNTLGVIYQRRGLDALAEQAFQASLERQVDNPTALRNLAKLLDAQNRSRESAPLHERLARIERDPPFRHFDLGRAAAIAGDYQAARDHILRELKRDPDYHELHFWLAVALAGLGDATGAREHLARAMDNSTTRREQAIYAGKLARLQAH
jgi:tetratricopeptide (TPR) repeat protein